MLPPFIIEQIRKREEQERRRREAEQPRLEIPSDRPPISREKHDDDEGRGVVIVDLMA